MDLLGQAGILMESGVRDKRIFDDPQWNETLEDIARRTNEALASGDRGVAAGARARLFEGLEGFKATRSAAAELSIKACRNELIRVYVLRGWYEEAELVADEALRGLDIDRFCPNRESVLREIKARVLLAAGRLEEGEAELKTAIELSRAMIEKVHNAQETHWDSCELPER